MKKIKVLTICSTLLVTLLLTGCKNGDSDFPDFEGGTSVYFANQTPIRTLVMGEDEYDTTLDNQHKCQIQATMGGSYNGRDITLEVAVDESICNRLFFADGVTPVQPMPSNYYKLSSTTMRYEGFRGAIEVELTDDFFNDPKSLSANYVIPVVIKNQVGADRILSGTAWDAAENPQRTNLLRWQVVPQDYTLYCVKYICKYDANYLRHKGGVSGNIEWEKQEVKNDITTLSLNSIKYPADGCDLKITFGADDQVTSIESLTTGKTASGTGYYKANMWSRAWNNKDRDGLHLEYTIDGVKHVEDLCWQSRGVVKEEFSTIYK